MIRIGLIITPYKMEEELKEEFIQIDVKKRKWLSNVNKKHIIIKENKQYVTDDISIFHYLKYRLNKNKYEINLIYGNDNDILKKIKHNDIVFLIIFDKLEAFHLFTKKQYHEFQLIFEQKNIFPPFYYQNLINNKNLYYNYFKKKGINVLPFLFISKAEYTMDPKNNISKILNMKKGDNDKIIGKPLFGQEKIDFKIFHTPLQGYILEKYLEKIFCIYEGCIFQPYIKNLHKTYEYRVYFIGNQYSYCIKTKFLNDDENDLEHFDQIYIHQNNDIHFFNIKKFAEFVFNNLPEIIIFQQKTEKLLTRIDICFDRENQLFVSEIEFVPSLYSDLKEVDELQIDKKLGDQIIKITNSLQFPKKQNHIYLIIIIILLSLLIIFQSLNLFILKHR